MTQGDSRFVSRSLLLYWCGRLPGPWCRLLLDFYFNEGPGEANHILTNEEILIYRLECGERGNLWSETCLRREKEMIF